MMTEKKTSTNSRLTFGLWLLAIILSTFCACSSDDATTNEYSKDTKGTPFKLFASIQNSTSGTRFVITQDTLIHLNETVYIWADELKDLDTIPKIKCWTTTSDGNGILNPLYLSSRFYPISNYPLRMMGLHGNFHFKENASRPSLVSHTVKSDQTAMADYLISDLLSLDTLLYYNKLSADAGTFMLHLRFKHLLSRLELCFQPYGSLTDDSLNNARVFIENVYPTCELDIPKKTATTTGTPSSIEVKLERIPATATSFAGANYGEAVIPAQKVSEKNFLIRLQTAYGRDYYFVPDTTYTFEPGKRYRFNMLVKHHIKFDLGSDPWDDKHTGVEWSLEPITVTPEILPWGDNSKSTSWSWVIPSPNVASWVDRDSLRVMSIVPPGP